MSKYKEFVDNLANNEDKKVQELAIQHQLRINDAIQLLLAEEYYVTKITADMKKDMLDCEAHDESTEDDAEEKECLGCSCSICIVQQ